MWLTPKRVLIGGGGLIAFFWIDMLFHIAVAFAPYNPLSPSKYYKMNLSLFVVEGWAFFTRNPREPNLHLFKPDANGKLYDVTTLNNDPKNLFGFSREARSLSLELGKILENLDSAQWQPMASNLDSQFLVLPAANVVNTINHPKLHDSFLVEYRDRIPWAWVDSYDQIKMPSKVIKIHVNLR